MGCQDTWCVLCGGPLGGYAADAETVRDMVLDEAEDDSAEFRRRYPVEVRLRAAAAWLDQVTALTSAGGVVHGLTETACNGVFEDWPRRTRTFVWAINDARWDRKEKRYVFGPEACIPVHTDCYILAEQMGVRLTFADLLPIFPFGFSEPSGSSLPEVRTIDYRPIDKYHSQMFDDTLDEYKLWEHPEDWYVVYSPLDTTPSNATWVKKNRARVQSIVKAVVAATQAPPKSTLAAMAMSPTQLKQLSTRKAAKKATPKRTTPKRTTPKKASKKVTPKKAPKKASKKASKKAAPKKASKKAMPKKRPERPSPTVSATSFPLRTRRKKGGDTYEVVGYKRQGKLIKRWKKVAK